jgi:hypothetical protein
MSKLSTILRTDCEHENWQYELSQYKHTYTQVNKAMILGKIDPSGASVIMNEELKDLKRFIWYCIGEVAPF